MGTAARSRRDNMVVTLETLRSGSVHNNRDERVAKLVRADPRPPYRELRQQCQKGPLLLDQNPLGRNAGSPSG